jgi:hypothetical protein
MAPRMSDKASPRFGAGYGELDLIHYFMKPDHLTAAVAGSVTSATSERLATEYGRELSSAHTLTDERAQFFLVHNPSVLPGKGLNNGGSRSLSTIKQVKTLTFSDWADLSRRRAYFAFSAMTLHSASIAARRAVVFRQTPPTCRTGAGRVKGRITTPRALP